MNKQDLKTVFGILVVFILILGSIAIFDQTQAGASENPAAHAEQNISGTF